MIYKHYAEGDVKFTTENLLGAPIGQDVKNRDENSEKKKTMTINTKKIAKKNGGDKNYNPIKYSYKPGVRKQKLNSY